MFKQYARDFNLIVNTTYKIVNGGYARNPKGYVRTLSRAMREVVNNRKSYRNILRDDIVQQLSLMWLEFETDYNNKKPNVSRRRYIIWRSIFGLKDWLNKELREQYDLYSPEFPDEEELEQRINVQFLVSGTSEFPYSLLTPYERYILFLRFYKDLDIQDMAVLMKKSRQTVQKLLTQVIEKLRRQEWNLKNIPKKIM